MREGVGVEALDAGQADEELFESYAMKSATALRHQQGCWDGVMAQSNNGRVFYYPSLW